MPLLQFFTRRGCDMYKFVVAISGLTFVLECWKFIWQVELDKRNKSKKPPTTETRRRLNITLKLSFRRQTVCNGSLCFFIITFLFQRSKHSFVRVTAAPTIITHTFEGYSTFKSRHSRRLYILLSNILRLSPVTPRDYTYIREFVLSIYSRYKFVKEVNNLIKQCSYFTVRQLS